VLFLNTTRNSMNSRYLPLAAVRTEAIFNMDDDFNVSHDVILFSFRVWRSHRRAVVGPNFRLCYTDSQGKGVYEPRHQCQYNMVIPSGAFIHRDYLRAYAMEMPEVVREKVDETMNCEDIAFNFLVAHLTRRAPVKTTPVVNTRWGEVYEEVYKI